MDRFLFVHETVKRYYTNVKPFHEEVGMSTKLFIPFSVLLHIKTVLAVATVRLTRMKDTCRLKLSHLYCPSMVWSWSPQSTKTQMNRNRKQKLKKFVNKYVQDYKHINEPYFFNRITPKLCYFFMSYINIMHKKRWSNILFRLKITFKLDNLFPTYFRRTMTVLMVLTKEIQSVCLKCKNIVM